MSRLRLTPQSIKGLPPVGTSYRDTVVAGLALRVFASGARSFVVEYGLAGKTHRFTLGPTPPLPLAMARKKAAEIMARVRLGEDPREAQRLRLQRGLTVEDLAVRFLSQFKGKPKTSAEYERLVGVDILPKLGEIPATQLSRARIRDWSRAIADGAPYVANRAFETLRRVYSWSVGEDLIPGSPFVGLKAPTTERSSDRVLTTPELRALLLALDDVPGQYADATLLLLLTLARREMVIGAARPELSDLDAEAPAWGIPADRMKGDAAFVVPLSPQAVTVFKRCETGTMLFPPQRTSGHSSMGWSSRFVDELRVKVEERRWVEIHGAWNPIEGEAHPREKVPRWTVHNLRHTAATHMREDLDVSSEVVDLLLAHKPGTQVGRIYNRAELLPERRAALVAWGAWLDRLKAGEGEKARVLPMRKRKAASS